MLCPQQGGSLVGWFAGLLDAGSPGTPGAGRLPRKVAKSHSKASVGIVQAAG